MIFNRKEGLPPHLHEQADKKFIILIIISIIVIIAIALIGINFLTGKTIISEGIVMEDGKTITPKAPTTELTISPDPLTRGDYMTITMKSGKTGTDEIVKILDSEGQKIVSDLSMNCNGPTCFDETIIKIYKSGTEWEPGTYKVVAKDYATPETVQIEKAFTVVE